MTKTSKFIASIISAVALSGLVAVAPAHADTTSTTASSIIQTSAPISMFAKGRIIWCC